MKNLKCLIFIFISSICLSGCWDQNIFEKVGFVLIVGIEERRDNELLVTYTNPVFDPYVKEKVELLSIESNLIRSAREEARKTSAKSLEGGKIQQILLSNDIAEKGIHHLLEIFSREPTNPIISYVIVVEGSPNKLLKATDAFEDKPLPAFYINQLLENNIDSSYIPRTRIFNFESKYFSPGIDPIAPLINLETEKGKGIEIEGTALFSEDKMVGKINPRQTALLLAMMKEMKSVEYISKEEFQDVKKVMKKGAAVLLRSKKNKIKVSIIDNKPEVDISLTFNGRLDELQWHSKYDRKLEGEIEYALSNEIKEECNTILSYMQSIGSDPIGIGDMVRAKYNPYWNTIDWKDAYKNVKFNVNVKIDIKQHGIIA